MTGHDRQSRSPIGLWLAGACLLLLGAAGGWWWESLRNDAAVSMNVRDRAAIEQVVREYVLNHPEILPEAMNNLQARENAKQLANVGEELEQPFPGAVLGNPEGSVVLVAFSDFGCTYCRQSVADVAALIRSNSDLKVVVRELPILSQESAEAAKWGLAAAEQGRYAAFHDAMFAAGRPAPETIDVAARAAGLDLDRARKVIIEPRIAAEIERNLAIARKLGFNGTPSWVIGEQLLAGAVGKEALQQAIIAAREKS